MANARIDFDGNWKAAITAFIEDFIAFYLPDLYKEIDFSKPVAFLEQELQEVLEAIQSDKRVTDKLVKVYLKNGKETWVLIHIEVQSYFEKAFNLRMFLMYAMILGKYNCDIIALAIYTNSQTPKDFDKFERKNFGTEVLYKFNFYKVMEQDESVLLASDNIFALFVLANIYVNNTRKSNQRRFELKERIVNLALQRNFDAAKVQEFLLFIDNIMMLPLNLQLKFIDSTKQKVNDMANSIPATRFQNGLGKVWVDEFNKMFYGDTFENLIEKEREKEREKDRAIVLRLHKEKGWSAEIIADILTLPIEEVKQFITGKDKK